MQNLHPRYPQAQCWMTCWQVVQDFHHSHKPILITVVAVCSSMYITIVPTWKQKSYFSLISWISCRELSMGEIHWNTLNIDTYTFAFFQVSMPFCLIRFSMFFPRLIPTRKTTLRKTVQYMAALAPKLRRQISSTGGFHQFTGCNQRRHIGGFQLVMGISP